jgi:hypothetical protein
VDNLHWIRPHVLCSPLDDTGAQLQFRFVAAAYERRALGIVGNLGSTLFNAG